jgi:TRAP-type C4-dicarboxylate transport system permease small subunit
VKKIEHALYVLLGVTAGMALLAMMLLAFVDVSARKLSMPIPGGVELTELLMVILIFSGLPLVSMRGEHVTFDLFDRYFAPAFRAALIRVMQLLAGLAFAALAYFMWLRAARLLDDGLTTAQLGIVVGPFAFVMSVMLGLTALVHIVLAITGRTKMDDHAQAAPPGQHS